VPAAASGGVPQGSLLRPLAVGILVFLGTGAALSVVILVLTLVLEHPADAQGIRNVGVRLVVMLYAADFVAALVAAALVARRNQAGGSHARRLSVAMTSPVALTTALLVYQASDPTQRHVGLVVAAGSVLLGALSGALLGSGRGVNPRPKVARRVAGGRGPRPTGLAVIALFGGSVVPMRSLPILSSLGSDTPAAPSPSECIVEARTGEVARSVTLFGVALGGPYSFEETRSAAGKYEVTADRGAALGVTAAIGAKTIVKVISAALQISLTGKANLADSYEVESRAEADDLVFDIAARNDAKLAGPAGLLYQDADTIEQQAKAALNGQGFVLPARTKRTFKLGVEAQLTGSLGQASTRGPNSAKRHDWVTSRSHVGDRGGQKGPTLFDGRYQKVSGDWYFSDGKTKAPAPTEGEVAEANAHWVHPTQQKGSPTMADGRWLDRNGKWRDAGGRTAPAPSATEQLDALNNELPHLPGVAASVTLGASIGGSVSHVGGNDTVDLYFVLSGEAGLELADKLDGDAGGDATMTLEVAKRSGTSDYSYRPTKASFDVTGRFSGDFSPKLTGADFLGEHSPLKNSEAKAGPTGDKSVELEASLDLTDPANLASIVAYVAALKGSDPQRPSPALEAATQQLVAQIVREADIRVSTFATNGVDASFSLLLGDLLTFGVGSDESYSAEHLVDAEYRSPSGPLTHWDDCVTSAAGRSSPRQAGLRSPSPRREE
jgi:hypothetical protein